MQGFSTGGQYGAAATYLSEIAEPGRRGFYASFQFVTRIGGQLFALLVIFGLQASMSEAAIRDWGWRLPFLLGAVLAGAFLLRAIRSRYRRLPIVVLDRKSVV